MAEEFVDVSLLWNDNDSWSFPVLATEEDNGGKELIEDGKIVLDVGGSDGPAENRNEAPPPAVNGGRTEAAVTAGRKRGRDGDGGEGSNNNHEQHIMTERERRKRMSDMFATLQSLIPDIHPKADKSAIVDAAVDYIKILQKTLEDLEEKKEVLLKGKNANPTGCDGVSITAQPNPAIQSVSAEQAGSSSEQAVVLASPSPMFSGPEFPARFKSYGSENVILNICGKDAHISVCSSKKPGPLSAITFVMEKYKIEVVSTHVSYYHDTRMYMIHAREMSSQQSPEALCLVEEIFKQAATEIMTWLQSLN